MHRDWSEEERLTLGFGSPDDPPFAGKQQALLAVLAGVPDAQEAVIQLGVLHQDDDLIPHGPWHVQDLADGLSWEVVGAAPGKQLLHVAHCGGKKHRVGYST